jgi:hypothetical protein
MASTRSPAAARLKTTALPSMSSRVFRIVVLL